MVTLSEVETLLGDFRLVVQKVKEFPQTKRTLLGEYVSDLSIDRSFTRKVSSAIEMGHMYKTTNFGSRFSKTVYYGLPKSYSILILSTRIGSTMYYFYDYEVLNEDKIKLTTYWELVKDGWNKVTEPTVIHSGQVLRWI
jgi:hypothetical protein